MNWTINVNVECCCEKNVLQYTSNKVFHLVTQKVKLLEMWVRVFKPKVSARGNRGPGLTGSNGNAGCVSLYSLAMLVMLVILLSLYSLVMLVMVWYHVQRQCKCFFLLLSREYIVQYHVEKQCRFSVCLFSFQYCIIQKVRYHVE